MQTYTDLVYIIKAVLNAGYEQGIGFHCVCCAKVNFTLLQPMTTKLFVYHLEYV